MSPPRAALELAFVSKVALSRREKGNFYVSVEKGKRIKEAKRNSRELKEETKEQRHKKNTREMRVLERETTQEGSHLL